MLSIDIPEGVTAIRESAFSNTGLKEVVIPESVRTIEKKSFFYCKDLVSVTIPAGVKKFERDIFSGCDNLTIHAPAGSVAETYAKKNNIPFEAI